MAITVTATQGGSTANGMALRVFVLTSAAGTQNGATTNTQFTSVTSFTQSVTTTQAGSRVYGASSCFPNNSATAAAATTVVDNIADATNNARYVTFKATSLTGTPGATTLGYTVGSASAGPFAQAEILTAGTLTEDGSAPAAVSTTSATTVTTASFTPPSGALLVALVAADGGAAVETMTVSGGGLTWTEQAKNNPSGGDYAGVWIAQVAASSAFVPLQASRRLPYRTPALPPVRRYRSLLPVPAQLNPPYPFAEVAQRRQAWSRGLPRRGHLSVVVPPQLNPPYPFAEIRQWRQPRGFWPRRGHGFTPVPAQQAAAPNPAITFQQPRHPRILFQRRGRAVMPVPAQDAVPAAPLRHARLALAPRRGHGAVNVPGQQDPAPQQRQAPRARAVPARRGRAALVKPAQAAVAPPAWVQSHRAPLRALALIRRRFLQLMPWPQATAPAFSIGRLTASTQSSTSAASTYAPTGASTTQSGVNTSTTSP